MKATFLCLCSLLALSSFIFAQTGENSEMDFIGEYVGQKTPGNHSEMFAPGFISTEVRELNSVLCCEGNEFYFSRRGVQGKPSTLMVTKRIKNTWTYPQPVGISGMYNDIDLFITPDGNSMVFCSRRPHNENGKERFDHDFWLSKREADTWSEPVLFAKEALSEYEDFYPVITASGNLYFNSQRGGQRGNNIYCSKYQDGEHSAAIKLPEPINSQDWEFDAFVTQDEKTILFSSTRPGGYGGADIYISYLSAEGVWTEPKNLGPEVNSEHYEYGTSISPDGKYLFFTSTRDGAENIYWISTDILSEEQPAIPVQQSSPTSTDIFLDHFRNHWDDIHDVIMRYHYVDPQLKGRVAINMTWSQGKLSNAEIQENTTGNKEYGLALIEALEAWYIPEITEGWSITLPIKTSIKGSEHNDFEEYGILTGMITDKNGKPLSGIKLTIQAQNGSHKPKTLYTNREGIFIETLLHPGIWQLSCSSADGDPITIKNIEIRKGKHCKRDIVL